VRRWVLVDREGWTHAAIDVYQELVDAGMPSMVAGDVTKTVLREFGRDLRNRDVNAAADSSWRGKPVSDSQRDILMQHGYIAGEVEEMTRGEASDVLDQILGDR